MSPSRRSTIAPLAPRLIGFRLLTLVRQPIFIGLTLWGHLWVVVGATLFHHYEADAAGLSWLDCLRWSVGLVTTTGHIPFAPTTTATKWLELAMMTGGTVFVWSYMGLIVSALVSPELERVGREVRGVAHLEDEIVRLRAELERLRVAEGKDQT